MSRGSDKMKKAQKLTFQFLIAECDAKRFKIAI